MAIILEFKDYAEIHEAMGMLQEGLLGNMWNKIKDSFKGISSKVDETLASSEIDGMFDQKTGELTPEILAMINKIQDAASVKTAFDEIRKVVPKGWYFQQRLKFMEDGISTLMDQASVNKAGATAAGTTAAAKTQGTGNAQSTALEGEALKQMQARAADFDKIYGAAKKNIEAQVKTKMEELIKTASAEKNKAFINNRYATCNTVLILIEYDIKKLRLGLTQLEGLKKEMTDAYKLALDSAKQLQIAITQEGAKSMTPDAYKALDINGFIKEYPAQQAAADSSIAELFVYPYAEKHIVITAYDINQKTVTFMYADMNTKKVIAAQAEDGANVPFDVFKENLLEGSDGTPPVKQKGGSTGPTAAPATSTAQANA